MVPTVLDLLGIEPPATIRGVTQSPLQGVSFAQTLDDADAPSDHHTQYFEMLGHRAIYHDGWRAVCPWPGPSFAEAGVGFGHPISADTLTELDAKGWELYHVAEDFAETRNVAGEQPREAHRADRHVVRRGRKVRRPAVDGSGLARDARREATGGRAARSLRLLPEHAVDPVLRRAAGAQPSPQHHRQRRDPRRGRRGRAALPGLGGGRLLAVHQGRQLHYVHNYVGRELLQSLLTRAAARRVPTSSASSSSRRASRTWPKGRGHRVGSSSTSTARSSATQALPGARHRSSSTPATHLRRQPGLPGDRDYRPRSGSPARSLRHRRHLRRAHQGRRSRDETAPRAPVEGLRFRASTDAKAEVAGGPPEPSPRRPSVPALTSAAADISRSKGRTRFPDVRSPRELARAALGFHRCAVVELFRGAHRRPMVSPRPRALVQSPAWRPSRSNSRPWRFPRWPPASPFLKDDRPCLAAGARARRRGYYTRSELLLVCEWKTGRSKSLVARNIEEDVKFVTGEVLSVSDERTRMSTMCWLWGVDVPTASALLFPVFPDHDPIIYVRALESLGQPKPRHYSLKLIGRRYLDACRTIAEERRPDQDARQGLVASIGRGDLCEVLAAVPGREVNCATTAVVHRTPAHTSVTEAPPSPSTPAQLPHEFFVQSPG